MVFIKAKTYKILAISLKKSIVTPSCRRRMKFNHKKVGIYKTGLVFLNRNLPIMDYKELTELNEKVNFIQ